MMITHAVQLPRLHAATHARRSGAAARGTKLRTVAAASGEAAGGGASVATASGAAKVTFLGAGGEAVEVECPKDTYILDAGLKAGLELPYTCKAGLCGACVVKVVKGSVDQSDIDDISWTLTDEEVAEGMALICMARPLEDVACETQSDWGYGLGITEWKGPTGKITGGSVDPLMGQKWSDMQKEDGTQAGT